MVSSSHCSHHQKSLQSSQQTKMPTSSLSSHSPYPSSSNSSLSISHQRVISLLFQVTTVVAIYIMCAQAVVGVNGQLWCFPTELPHTDNLYNKDNPEVIVFSQPVWWKEYYYINASINGTLTFKVYPSRPSDIAMSLYKWENDCPQPQESWYDQISYGINHVLKLNVDVYAGMQLVFMVRMMGCNYTIVGGLPEAVPEYCPSDCNFRGYCDMNNGKCACESGWVGDACDTPVTKPKIPLGSWAAFYGTVIGVPVAVAAIVGGVVTILIMRKKRRVVVVRSSPLLINAPGPELTDDERARFLPPIE